MANKNKEPKEAPMKFEFHPTSPASTEKVRLDLPPEILSWADGIVEAAKAKDPGATREAVLVQAIHFARISQTRPTRSRKAKS
jgi:hypothetical protein